MGKSQKQSKGTAAAQHPAVARIDSTEWARPAARAAALESIQEVLALQSRLEALPGQPGCIDRDLEQVAQLLGINVKVLTSILVSGVSRLSWPTDSFDFEVLADRAWKRRVKSPVVSNEGRG